MSYHETLVRKENKLQRKEEALALQEALRLAQQERALVLRRFIESGEKYEAAKGTLERSKLREVIGEIKQEFPRALSDLEISYIPQYTLDTRENRDITTGLYVHLEWDKKQTAKGPEERSCNIKVSASGELEFGPYVFFDGNPFGGKILSEEDWTDNTKAIEKAVYSLMGASKSKPINENLEKYPTTPPFTIVLKS